MAKLAASFSALALLLGAPAALAFDPKCDPNVETCEPTPWYRGNENSKLRLRYDFGPASVIVKGPKRDRMIELRFVIRF